MKKTALLFTFSFLICLVTSAQTDSTFNVEQALINGCNDGKNARGGEPFTSTYYSIMNNPSISDEYKDAYNEGYTRCYAGGNFYWSKGELVYEPPKNDKDTTIKPGVYDWKTYFGGLKKL